MFEILLNDAEFLSWTDAFEDEIKVQELDDLIDPRFDPGVLEDHYNKLLYHKKNVYFWSILRQVLCNALGISCLSDH